MSYLMHLPWYAYIFLAVMAVSFIAVKALPFLKKMKGVFGSYHKNPGGSTLTEHEQKALAVGAINGEQTACYIDSLETGLAKDTIKQALNEWWGIYSSDDAKNTLDWLKQQGHRFYYDRIFPIFERVSKDKWADSLNMYFKDDHDDAVKAGEYLNNLSETIKQMKDQDSISDESFEKGVLAWDMGRLVTVARLAHDMNLISRDEAWVYIKNAHEESKKLFSDWKELAHSYIIGRAMWSGDDMALSGIKSISRGLLEDENSPWYSVHI